jgi:hypothetical protein
MAQAIFLTIRSACCQMRLDRRGVRLEVVGMNQRFQRVGGVGELVVGLT